MYRLDNSFGRLLLPVLAGAFGTALYIFSPLSHQAFCTPMTVPVLLTPETLAPGGE